MKGLNLFILCAYLYRRTLYAGNDHGIKSQGDGWKVTVALVEAVNLPSLDATELSDPFVVFTCNGKTRTSSVQLQTCDPQWNGLAFAYSISCSCFFSI